MEIFINGQSVPENLRVSITVGADRSVFITGPVSFAATLESLINQEVTVELIEDGETIASALATIERVQINGINGAPPTVTFVEASGTAKPLSDDGRFFFTA